MEHLPSPQRQIAAGDIQTGHQQVAAGGSLGQVDDLDAEAWKALNMRTRYYTTKLHIGAFYLPAFLRCV